MNDCLPHVKACRLRVARLGSDGVPEPGAENLYVSDALVLITASPEIEAGTETIERNGCGDICVNLKDEDKVKRYTVTLTVCTPDPQLHEILVGGRVAPDGLGYMFPRLNSAISPNGVSIEAWAWRPLSDGSLDATYPYAQWAFPRVKLTPGERSLQNGALQNPFTGFLTENENWYDGPANDWRDVPFEGPFGWQAVADIPDADCGYQTLIAS